MTTPDADSNQLGKRYECPTCGTELLCTRRGAGRFECHGAPMQVKSVQPLPSSD
jgi:hypothetical protein